GGGIGAVDARAGDAERARDLAEVAARMHQRRIALAGRPRAGAVVLAHEQDRQLPQRRDVERLEADAFLERAVAEKTRAERAVLLALAGIAAADPEADGAADDARGGEKSQRRVAEMQRAAAAAVEAVGAAENLRQGAAGIGAAREHVAMVAVGRVDAI